MIEEALANYAFAQPEPRFIRHNENITYAVADGDKQYLLRIHQAAEGLDFAFQLGSVPRHVFVQSEVELLKRLHLAGAGVQRPVRNRQGEYVTRLEHGELATVLTWLDGEDLSGAECTPDLARQVGQALGRLHRLTAGLPPMGRYRYDQAMNGRILDELGRGLAQGHLTNSLYGAAQRRISAMDETLSRESARLTLVHGDLTPSNLIACRGQIIPIDFSLSGYALPEMDLADIALGLGQEHVPALLEGYRAAGGHPIRQACLEHYNAYSMILAIAYHHDKWSKSEKGRSRMDRWRGQIDPAGESVS